MTAPVPPSSPAAHGTRLPGFLDRRVGGLPAAFWTLCAGMLINRVGTMVEPFLGLYLTTQRGLSLAQAGLALGLLGLGSVFAQLIGGALADRIGRRATLSLAMAANGMALLAMGYVRGVVPIMITAVLLGLVLDMYRPASAALVADLIPAADRPRAFGLLFWAINLGFAIAMVLGGALASAGFYWLFWADALTCGVFAALVWRAVPETRARRPRAGREPGGFADVLRDPVMMGYVLVFLAYTSVLMQAFTTLPLAMREDGLSPQAYGFAVAANGIVIIVLQPLAGAWLTTRDHSLVVAAGLLVVGGGNAAYLLASGKWTYAAAVAAWTVGEGVIAAVGQAIVADLAPEHLRGRYNGLWGVAWSGGFLLAPMYGTRLLEIGAPALWLTCAGICAAAALAQFALGPAIRRRAALTAALATGPGTGAAAADAHPA